VASKSSSTARGYGQKHRNATAAMAPVVRAGGVLCVRCGGPVSDTKVRRRDGKLVPSWVLDHNEARTGYLGVSHLTCNARNEAQRTNAKRAARRRPRVPGGVFGPLSS
jgi:hypothetical protein